MKKILLAEDDRPISNTLANKLKRHDFEVLQAPNGKEALKMIKTDKPDLVLLDLIMPIMDGFTVLENLKKENLIKKTPIIVFSNLGQKSDIEKVEALGVKNYLVKSDMSLNDVIGKINEVLSGDKK